MLKRNQESWSNCSTDQLHNAKAIRIWNSTKTWNKGSITSPKQKIYDNIAPVNNYSDISSTAEHKKSLRKDFLARRCSLPNTEVLIYSKMICEIFTSLPEFEKSKDIAIYFPVNNEVDTFGLFERINLTGKASYFPKVADNGISFHKISNLNELETGSYGIPEPADSLISAGINDIDLFIVPGICFDTKGSRLGYGKGLYDKALKKVSSSKIYTFCYSFQILNNIPSDKNDKNVGHIVSESGVISF